MRISQVYGFLREAEDFAPAGERLVRYVYGGARGGTARRGEGRGGGRGDEVMTVMAILKHNILWDRNTSRCVGCSRNYDDGR